jgi:hypothetical protein
MFKLTEDQQEETKEWMTGHDCPIGYEGAIGGKITYNFTPTGIGVVEKSDLFLRERSRPD